MENVHNGTDTNGVKPISSEDIIVSNPNVLDTVGLKVEDGDWIYLFNDNQENKKWSLEQVEDINGKLFSRFNKYLGPVYTPLENVPCNHIMLLKNKDGMCVFCTDAIVYNFKKDS